MYPKCIYSSSFMIVISSIKISSQAKEKWELKYRMCFLKYKASRSVWLESSHRSSTGTSCHSFSMAPLCQTLTWRVHPFLFMCLKISSHDRACCSFIKFHHDLLAPCNLCLLVVLENQPPVLLWLVDELPKLQSCLELCLFAQVLLQLG
jgi:hypothetical protein